MYWGQAHPGRGLRPGQHCLDLGGGEVPVDGHLRPAVEKDRADGDLPARRPGPLAEVRHWPAVLIAAGVVATAPRWAVRAARTAGGHGSRPFGCLSQISMPCRTQFREAFGLVASVSIADNDQLYAIEWAGDERPPGRPSGTAAPFGYYGAKAPVRPPDRRRCQAAQPGRGHQRHRRRGHPLLHRAAHRCRPARPGLQAHPLLPRRVRVLRRPGDRPGPEQADRIIRTGVNDVAGNGNPRWHLLADTAGVCRSSPLLVVHVDLAAVHVVLVPVPHRSTTNQRTER